jgi:hypothetical protein
MLVLFCLLPLYGQSTIAELDDWGEKIMDMLGSGWVQAICALAFAIEAGACIYMSRQGEGGVVKRFLPWMIGTIGLLSASSITSFFFGGAK